MIEQWNIGDMSQILVRWRRPASAKTSGGVTRTRSRIAFISDVWGRSRTDRDDTICLFWLYTIEHNAISLLEELQAVGPG